MKKQFQWLKMGNVVRIFEGKNKDIKKYDSIKIILKEIRTIFQDEKIVIKFEDDLRFVYTPATNCVALEVYDCLLDYRFYNIMQGKPSKEEVTKNCKEMISNLGSELHPKCKIIYNFDELFCSNELVKFKI